MINDTMNASQLTSNSTASRHMGNCYPVRPAPYRQPNGAGPAVDPVYLYPSPSLSQPSITDRMVDAMQKMAEQFTVTINKALETISTLTEKLSAALTAKADAAAPASSNPATGNATPTDTTGEKEAKPTTLPKSGEFLWKPESDKDKKLVVLLPSNLTGKVKNVVVTDKDGKKIAQGKYSGIGNGDREHFRFTKAGDTFPKGSIVEIHLKDGSTKQVKISSPEKRTTR